MLTPLALILAFAAAGIQQRPQPHPQPMPLIRLVVINMSGQPRELHHRADTIPLPIAAPVAIQVPAGDTLQITSTTDAHIQSTIPITTKDAGRTIPIR